MSQNRQWILRARPPGEVGAAHFEIRSVARPVPGANEVLVRTIYLLVPPAMRLWMNENASCHHAHIKRWHFLGKGRRRRTRIGEVLVPMPWAHDASVDDAAFAERAILMLTDVRNRGDLTVVPKDRHAFS